jgi:hypothetical protein
VQAQFEVYEGQSHAQYLFDDRLPETAVAFGEIAEFFDKHLGNSRDGKLRHGRPPPRRIRRRGFRTVLRVEALGPLSGAADDRSRRPLRYGVSVLSH